MPKRFHDHFTCERMSTDSPHKWTADEVLVCRLAARSKTNTLLTMQIDDARVSTPSLRQEWCYRTPIRRKAVSAMRRANFARENAERPVAVRLPIWPEFRSAQ